VQLPHLETSGGSRDPTREGRPATGDATLPPWRLGA
jgi:hypothetical protein